MKHSLCEHQSGPYRIPILGEQMVKWDISTVQS
jgi:hypothetical protein